MRSRARRVARVMDDLHWMRRRRVPGHRRNLITRADWYLFAMIALCFACWFGRAS